MHWIFVLAHFLPFWAIPLAGALVQLAVHFRRRGSVLQWYFGVLAVGLVVASGAWIYFRGDRHSERWLKTFIEVYDATS